MAPRSTEERVAVLEAQTDHIRDDIKELTDRVERLAEKIDGLAEIFEQAKGAKRVMVVAVTVATAAANAVGWLYSKGGPR